jgi:hypothetical protein
LTHREKPVTNFAALSNATCTNYTSACHVRNFHRFADPDPTPDQQLYWLEGVLARARAGGRKVIIAGHIAPGLWGGCWGAYSEAYEAVVAAAADVVAAQLFGHQHSGSFRVLRGTRGGGDSGGGSGGGGAGGGGGGGGSGSGGGDSGSSGDSSGGGAGGSEEAVPPPPPLTGVAFVTPSVTPFKDQDPSFRVYKVAVGLEEGEQEGVESESGNRAGRTVGIDFGVLGFEQYSASTANSRGLAAVGLYKLKSS